jgi:hypothetical protein
MVLAMGCYSLTPVAGQPLPLGMIVALDINDAGRVGLGGQMGPSISSIQGRLVEKDSAEYVLAVTQIYLQGGGDQVWSGERVRVKSEYVSAVSERKFSRTKTALLSAAIVGVAAIVVRQGIVGAFSPEETQPPDSANSIRYPRFKR